MPDYHPPKEDMKFVLNELLRVGSQHELSGYEAVDEDLVSSIIDSFGDFAAKEVGALNAEGDLAGASLGPDGVRSAPGFVELYRHYSEGGWPALTGDPEHGGDGMPGILNTIVEEMLAGANLAFAMAPLTAPGAYRVIRHGGSEAIQEQYLPKIVSGRWGTAMSLTEPQGGSALAFTRTRALPNGDGTFSITGTKMFNSWGDHDLTENIVHLVLARLPDAPAGIKGISLFLVPKYLLDSKGDIGERNSFSVGSLEKKLGVHASPTCVTNFDGATGFLIGQPHRGMAAMFIIMNSMRLASGVCAVGIADAAYRNAAAYARERLAARSPLGPRYPYLAGDPIIVQPDVRRMLLTQRAIVEGGRAFCFWVSLDLDTAERHSDTAERRAREARVSLLTPVVKAFLTDKAFECTDQALQCFGGHGYIWDNGAEQYLRDARMLRIGEGTSGIQALDLLGRKVLTDDGTALKDYFSTIRSTLRNVDCPDGILDPVRRTLQEVEQLVDEQLPRWKRNPEDMAAAATDFLHLIGYLSLGFMWVQMVHTVETSETCSVEMRENKTNTGLFYCKHLLPECGPLVERIRRGAEVLMSLPDDRF
ncbi:acyl-CoA dehydrogenase [Nocardia cyriacigeorgica]|uniref:Acyl-CoA dehydrogenase n=1 Tax=Nocardia cyriacigeorgica TaxID=135487 RepID=A0A6P1CU40_9NOCA|nr:acyl-CoA dehydrogenase family protein [Nocardia cyriacigeorgica]NEW36041.1 acyl-CoA dehydrogenase [Nocardia cyriacigeorgica]